MSPMHQKNDHPCYELCTPGSFPSHESVITHNNDQTRIQGRFLEHQKLASLTWLQVGGPCALMFFPKNAEDLSLFLKMCHNLRAAFALAQGWDIQDMGMRPQPEEKYLEDWIASHRALFSPLEGHEFFTCEATSLDESHLLIPSLKILVRSIFHGPALVLGAGSNILVRDVGVKNIVIKLGKGFHQWVQNGQDFYLGAGLLNRFVAQECQRLGFSGLEFIHTIPGTIGGGLAMNAGCFGGEFARAVAWLSVMDPQGNINTLDAQAMKYGYRCHGLPRDWIILGGAFSLSSKSSHEIAATMNAMQEERDLRQPTHVRTGGSTFANPQGASAWSLIDSVGFRGKKLGQAQFSQKHCNFLINLGGASAKDLEELGEQARSAVKHCHNIDLKWEIVRWG